MLYANSRSGDTARCCWSCRAWTPPGKGGIVKHVVGSGNPQGIRYTSFGKPTEEELSHHYLWRIRTGAADQRGTSGSSTGRTTRTCSWSGCTTWCRPRCGASATTRSTGSSANSSTPVRRSSRWRCSSRSNEQKKRLAQRLDRPDKYWKYNPADIDERMLWPKYEEAYQAVLDKTSTDYAPWHVVPCDRKWYSRLAITELLIEALDGPRLVLASQPISTSRPRRSGSPRPEPVAAVRP